MRQRRWLELLKDYDLNIQYHPKKANVVADALSRKFRKIEGSLNKLMSTQDKLFEDFCRMNITGTCKSSLPYKRRFYKLRQVIDTYNGSDKEFKMERHRDFSSMKMDLRDYMAGGVYRIMRNLSGKSWKKHIRHPGGNKLYQDLRQRFWWGLPPTIHGMNSIWVIVDRLTKSSHFLPIKTSWSVDRLADIYVKEIVRLHGAPSSIVSDRDTRFQVRLWQGLQKAFGTRLNFSTAFHPASDGQTERTIQTLEDGSWDHHLPLVEFAYNNSYHASIGMAPFEALYSRKYRSPICWDDIEDILVVGPELAQETADKVKLIQTQMKAAQDRKKIHVDVRRRPLEFIVGDHVFLKFSPTKGVMRFGKKGKLSPRYIGPFEILERIGEVAYRLALPVGLAGIHNVFHISMLRKYEPDSKHVIQHEQVGLNEDLFYEERPEEIVDHMVKILKEIEVPLVKVRWSNHTTREATWELEEDMRKRYPALFPFSRTKLLARREKCNTPRVRSSLVGLKSTFANPDPASPDPRQHPSMPETTIA
ncbi:Transposon Ty3-G Gag-Pol polyprotein-like protein [Drosera capensis]